MLEYYRFDDSENPRPTRKDRKRYLDSLSLLAGQVLEQNGLTPKLQITKNGTIKPTDSQIPNGHTLRVFSDRIKLGPRLVEVCVGVGMIKPEPTPAGSLSIVSTRSVINSIVLDRFESSELAGQHPHASHITHANLSSLRTALNDQVKLAVCSPDSFYLGEAFASADQLLDDVELDWVLPSVA